MNVAKTVIIDGDGKYLLLTRSNHPRFSLDADLPGGGVESGEQPIDGAVRELQEETGIRVAPGDLKRLYSGVDYSGHSTTYHLYKLQLQHRPNITLSWEHSSYEWISSGDFVKKSEGAIDTYMHMVAEVTGTDEQVVYGDIKHMTGEERQDFLFRVSLKAVIFNHRGEILVIKEKGSDWWDIPGGGMEHGESLKGALARELREEIALEGDFEYEVILTEDARLLVDHNLYQMRITFIVQPTQSDFSCGDDSDEVKFIDPSDFKNSELATDRKIYEYSQIARIRSM